MARRIQRGPTDQRKVTLPAHFWELLEEISELQSEAFKLMGGKTKYTPSDLLEHGARLYIRQFVKEAGELPKSPEQRKAYVKRLAEQNRDDLLAELFDSTDA